ncbi:MAG: alanine--tRNA ligase [Beijerinckiaceae bacterium]
MSGVNEIRSTFLGYFQKNGHEVVASSSLVPKNDPTLMFANSGMVQFKNVFTGQEKRPYVRATSAQKSVRAGGKHNDLDNVGYTARHHTFFEMLGNFSFGDYFKDRAIELAWNLVTKEYGLPKDKLTVTVYHEDEEAFGLWKKIAGLPEDRIIRIATSDNFWRMGDTGPCGPCSEIFFDHGPKIPGGPPGSADQDGDRFIEIWNLVFMQYEEQVGGGRTVLPRPSIDTGMGLERIAAVMQGTHDNYNIDLFQALIRAVSEIVGGDPDGPQKASYRVIADHVRCAAFLVADGILPSNEGRGYVLRRIMRRGMRHGQLLGAREPMLYRLVPTLLREMGQAYPELVRAEALISETMKLEETRFRKTLERGLHLLDDETRDLATGGVLSGETAFKLYDTFGFPLDLTQDALRGRGMSVDTEAFTKAMARQKAEARKAWSGSGEAATETVWFGIKDRSGATEFLGYETEEAEGVVAALVSDGKEVSSLATGAKGCIVLNQTPFYGESGGQAGDTGVITGEGFRFRVTETQKKLTDVFVHFGSVEEGSIQPGLAVVLKVDHARRQAIRANHSATHLLHEALRHILGDHVAQKGSLVNSERLRFDISHNKPISAAEVQAVEDMANAIILQNAQVTTRLMAVDDAVASGARALFGEKYGDEVRVVSMGVFPDGQDASKAYSIELCGGTHVGRTGDIGLVSVVAEAAVASGVRRIEALTGDAARRALGEDSRRLRDVAGLLKTSVADAVARVTILAEERRKLEREVVDLRRKLAMTGGGAQSAEEDIREIAGIRFLGRALQGVEMKDLKGIADDGKSRLGSGIVTIVGVSADGKAGIVVGVTPDLVSRFSAVDLVRIGSEALGGKGGGGRPDMAQAGGPDGTAAAAAVEAVANAMAGV